MKLTVIPMSLREANDFVQSFHRHGGRTSRDGGKFAIGASDGDELWGVAIVGRPLARMMSDGYTAEVLRLCVRDAPPRNVGSFLYAASWRAWQAQGGRRIITYTLATESGASLRGAGYTLVAHSRPHPAGWSSNGRERRWRSIYGQEKFRWEHPTAPLAPDAERAEAPSVGAGQ